MADKKDAKGKAVKPAAKAAAPKATAKAAPKAAAKPKAARKRAVARPKYVPEARKSVTKALRGQDSTPPRTQAEAAPKPKREPRPLPSAPAGQAPVIGLDGAVAGTIDLPAAIASAKKRAGVLFQALTASAANARQATAATKNRARVSGGGAKPWRQKGTGRARAGSTRSPLWRHGGVVFGPNGRRFEQRMPEKMRRAAFAEALASLAVDGRFMVYEGLPFNGDRPKTKVVMGWLDKVGDTGRALFVTGEVDAAAGQATANAKDVGLRTVGTLRTEDVLWHDTLFVRRDALESLAARATVGGGAA